jgi:hypothetical protein
MIDGSLEGGGFPTRQLEPEVALDLFTEHGILNPGKVDLIGTPRASSMATNRSSLIAFIQGVVEANPAS